MDITSKALNIFLLHMILHLAMYCALGGSPIKHCAHASHILPARSLVRQHEQVEQIRHMFSLQVEQILDLFNLFNLTGWTNAGFVQLVQPDRLNKCRICSTCSTWQVEQVGLILFNLFNLLFNHLFNLRLKFCWNFNQIQPNFRLNFNLQIEIRLKF